MKETLYEETALFKLAARAEYLYNHWNSYLHNYYIPSHVRNINHGEEISEDDLPDIENLDNHRKRQDDCYREYQMLLSEIREHLTVSGCKIIKESSLSFRIGPEFLTVMNPNNYRITISEHNLMEIERRNYYTH